MTFKDRCNFYNLPFDSVKNTVISFDEFPEVIFFPFGNLSA